MIDSFIFVHKDTDRNWRLYVADDNGRICWMSADSFVSKDDADRLLDTVRRFVPAVI
jgi:uncharacterized protein YegP (UPF0339 family)